MVTIDRNPDCWMAYNNLGWDFTRIGEQPAAIKNYRAAIRIKSNYYESHENLGLALESTGQMREAMEQLNEALRLREKAQKRGVLYLERGRYRQPCFAGAQGRAQIILPAIVAAQRLAEDRRFALLAPRL